MTSFLSSPFQMAHHTYTTKAFVLDTRASGEAHRYVALLTEELGLVHALARSARRSSSKLRYHVEPLSFGVYALVQGKEIWRLVGAHASCNYYYAFVGQGEVPQMLARYALLLKRLLGSEERQGALFALLEEGLRFLDRECPHGKMLQNFEYLLVLRTLLILGYVGEHEALREVLGPFPITADTLVRLAPLRAQVARHINRALRESQL